MQDPQAQSPIKFHGSLPAVSEFGAHILQVGIPHVVDGEHKEMVILLHTFPDIGIKPAGLLLVVLLGSLRLVDDARTL